MRSTPARQLPPPGWTCRRTDPLTHWLLLSALACALVTSPVLAQDEGEIDEGVAAEPAAETTVPGEAEAGPESDAPPPVVLPPRVAPPPTAPARLLEPQPLGLVDIRGWSFTHIVHEGHHVYHQPTVRPDRLQRALIAISRAHAHAPSVLGVATPDVEYYLFPSQADMRRGLPVLARVPIQSALVVANGLAFQDAGHHHVTFLQAEAFDNELRGTWAVAHELTHHLQARLAGNKDYAQWFNEGIAEYVGSRVARQFHPDEHALDSFLEMGQIVNALRNRELPALGPLVTNAQWVAARRTNRSGLLYSTAWLTVEWLVSQRDPGGLTRTLAQVEQGRSFPEAFTEVFGVPLAELDAAFQAHVTAALTPGYPLGLNAFRDSAPTSGGIHFVFSLQPRERARVDVRSSQCRGGSTVTADAVGFAAYSFSAPAGCAGTYTITMTGSQGTSGTMQFTLT